MPWRPKRPPFPWRTLLKVLLPVVALALAAGVVSTVLEQRRPPNQVRRLKERAGLHRQVGQLDEAAAALEQARLLDPDDAALPVLLAQVRQAQGRAGDAEAALRAANARRPDDPQLTVPLARLLLDTGRPMEAAELLEPALVAIRRVTDPLQRIDALLVAGRAAAGRGALLQAEALLREATRVGPAPVTAVAQGAAEACLALAELYTRSGRLPAAHEALAAARTYTPWDPRITLARARALELAGRTDEAVAELQPLVAAEAGPDLAAAAALGDVLLRAERPGDVAVLASRVEAAAAGGELAGALRAAAALGSDDRQAAVSAAARFAQAHPASPAARLAQGRAALAAGDLAAARGALEGAATAAPGLTEAAVLLLEVEERAGDPAARRARALDLLARPDARPWALRALAVAAAADPGALAAGRERLEGLLAARPADARLRVHTGLLRAATGDTARAAADLEPLTGAPDLARAASALADTPEGMLQAALAVEALAAHLLAGGGGPPPTRALLARALAALDRPWLAAALLEGHDDREALAARVHLALRTGDQARAATLLEALRAGDPPDDPGVLAALGEVRLLLGQAAAAVDLLERAAAATPKAGLLRARLGRAWAAAGDLGRARADHAAARALAPGLAMAHEDAALPLATGDAAAAAAALQAALDATGDPRFALALAAALAAQGQAREALGALERARGGPPEAHLLVVALLAQAGEVERARAAAARAPAPAPVREAACAAHPDAGARRALWSLIGLATLEWTGPARALAAALAADPRADALALWWATAAAERAGDPALALRLGERLVDLAPGDAPLALRLAAARGAAGDAPGDAALVRAVRERGARDPAHLVDLGVALERVGELAQAEAAYREALARGARSPVALNNLAWLLLADPARRADGLEHAREAVRLAPGAAEALDTLGWAHHLLGRSHEALPLLERASARLFNQPTVRFHLAVVLEALGRRDAARAALEVALRLPPGWPEEALARARLAALAAPR